MSAPAFDTLKFQQKLSEVLEPRTATVMAEAFAEATQNFGSKGDLDALERALRADNALLRQEVKAEITGVRSEMNALRADVSEKLRQQFVMMIGAVAGIVVLATAIIKLVP